MALRGPFERGSLTRYLRIAFGTPSTRLQPGSGTLKTDTRRVNQARGHERRAEKNRQKVQEK